MLGQGDAIDHRREVLNHAQYAKAADFREYAVVSAHDRIDRDLLDRCNVAPVEAKQFDQAQAELAGIFRFQRQRCGAALDDRLVEQAMRGGHCHEQRDFLAASRLAKNGDIVRVSSELRRVIAHPCQSLDKIEHPRAGRASETGVPVLQPGETEHAQPVVGADHHHIAVRGKVSARLIITRCRKSPQPATVEPDHDRPLTPVAKGGSPDVQCEAILAFGFTSRARMIGISLRRCRAIFRGAQWLLPGRGRRRRHEPVGAIGRATIGNAFERQSAADAIADHEARPGARRGGIDSTAGGSVQAPGQTSRRNSYDDRVGRAAWHDPRRAAARVGTIGEYKWSVKERGVGAPRRDQRPLTVDC